MGTGLGQFGHEGIQCKSSTACFPLLRPLPPTLRALSVSVSTYQLARSFAPVCRVALAQLHLCKDGQGGAHASKQVALGPYR